MHKAISLSCALLVRFKPLEELNHYSFCTRTLLLDNVSVEMMVCACVCVVCDLL